MVIAVTKKIIQEKLTPRDPAILYTKKKLVRKLTYPPPLSERGGGD